jgi:hypothetical protein
VLFKLASHQAMHILKKGMNKMKHHPVLLLSYGEKEGG